MRPSIKGRPDPVLGSPTVVLLHPGRFSGHTIIAVGTEVLIVARGLRLLMQSITHL
jgi:hypothetical protein